MHIKEHRIADSPLHLGIVSIHANVGIAILLDVETILCVFLPLHLKPMSMGVIGAPHIANVMLGICLIVKNMYHFMEDNLKPFMQCQSSGAIQCHSNSMHLAHVPVIHIGSITNIGLRWLGLYLKRNSSWKLPTKEPIVEDTIGNLKKLLGRGEFLVTYVSLK